MNNYLLLLMVNLLTCGGQLCQKQAARCWQQQSPVGYGALRWMLMALLLLVLGMLFWLRLLQYLPLSQAYPMLSLNLVLVTIGSQYFFNETVGLCYWLGIACIMSGIFLMSVS